MPSTVTGRLEGLETSVAVKAPCIVATTAAVTLDGLQTVNGVALSERDRVLVKDQADAVDNGIWLASSGTWRRALDFDGSRDAVAGTQVYVLSGTFAPDSYYKVDGTAPDPVDIGSDEITFTLAAASAAAEEAREIADNIVSSVTDLVVRAEEAAQQAISVVIGDIPIERLTAAFTFSDANKYKHTRLDTTIAAAVTLPTTPAIGSWGWIEQMGVGSNYFLPGAGAFLRTFNDQNQIPGQYGKAKVMKVTATEWLITGLDGIYAPAPPPSLDPPMYDAFGGSSATITGRVTDLGALTYVAVAYSGANANPIITDGAGFISGTQGTAPNSTFVYVQAAVSNKKWVRRTGKVAMYESGGTIGTSFTQVSHLSITAAGGTASLSGVALQHTGATGIAAASSLHCFNAGAVGAVSSFGTFITKVDGDSTDLAWDRSGSDRTATHYLNGRKCGATINVSTMAQSPSVFTDKFGFRGNMGASRVDAWMIGDPDADPMIRQFSPNRVAQVETDGSLNLKPRGTVTMQDPTALEVLIEDSTGTPIVDWTALGSYLADGLDYSGQAPNISPPGGGIVYKVRRSDVTGPSVVESNPSPLTMGGEVILWGGQSLTTNALAPPGTPLGGQLGAAPADTWTVHGWLGVGGTISYPNDYDRRQLKVVDNSPMADFCIEAFDETSAVPLLHVWGGRGGTDASQRLPGTVNHDAQLDGVRHAGYDVGSAIYGGGQFDVADPTLLANYIANIRTELNDVKALTGRDFKTLLIMLTSVWNVPDVDSETLRKQMWQATIDYPDEFFLGPYMMDAQHLPGDIYHWPNEWYAEELRRCASGWNLMRGESTVIDLRGPKLFSVTKDSSSQCTVLVDLNGFDDLSLLNYTYASDRRGGLRFAADSAFTVPLSPSGHSIGVVSAGKQPITYTFSGTPFSASSVYVSGPYGTEPFNPTWDATIRQDYANRASMLVGRMSGKPNVPIQPYYQTGPTGDYIHS